MLKKHWMNILLALTAVLILVTVALSFYYIYVRNNRNVIQLSISADESYSVDFKALGLLPGDDISYTLRVKSEEKQKYKMTLKFNETDTEQKLKDFVYVRIEMGDEVIYEKLLADSFTDEALSLDVDFTNVKKNEFRITYYMPEEVGNEAQNAEAFFELHITAENW